METGKDFTLPCGCVSEFVNGKYILIQCEECEEASYGRENEKFVQKTKMRTYREI